MLAALLVGLGSPAARAAGSGEGVGVGIALGSPTGVTVSPQLTPALSLDLLVGQSYYRGWGSSRVMLSLDLDVIVYEIARSNTARVYAYVGGGINSWVWGSYAVEVGLEVPLGVTVNLQKVPVQVYAEVLPQWVFVSWRGPEIGASVGARWWFELR